MTMESFLKKSNWKSICLCLLIILIWLETKYIQNFFVLVFDEVWKGCPFFFWIVLNCKTQKKEISKLFFSHVQMLWKKDYLPKTCCEYARTTKAYTVIFILAALYFNLLLLPMTEIDKEKYIIWNSFIGKVL